MTNGAFKSYSPPSLFMSSVGLHHRKVTQKWGAGKESMPRDYDKRTSSISSNLWSKTVKRQSRKKSLRKIVYRHLGKSISAERKLQLVIKGKDDIKACSHCLLMYNRLSDTM